MAQFKAFLLGVGVSYAVYFLNKKRKDGRSIMDDLLENPQKIMSDVKEQVIKELVIEMDNKIR